ncbi:MAG: AAA family ATPase, partial [Rhodospirillaceae bacterium]|nr:AAA family ATPase [Rhodospirillaceae bacterium]
ASKRSKQNGSSSPWHTIASASAISKPHRTKQQAYNETPKPKSDRLLEDIGQHELKGFAHAVPAFRPLRESTGNSRFEATRDTTLSNIVGRESELGFLWDRWNLANAGKGQVLLLSGEAGLGKSRLVRALADGLAGKNHYRLRYQCAPHYANSALYPIIQRLEQAAGFSSNDSGDDKLDKLERLLAVAEDDAASSMPFIAALMSLHDEKRHGALDLEPQELRARIMTALVRQLQGLSRLRPVFFVFEDAHWIDPSSVALLADLIAGISDLPVFMIITHRPEFEPPWKECGYMGRLTMNRLNSAQAAQIITNTVGEAPSREFVDEIVMRSEGNPLFIEELTKAVREASHLTEGKGMEIPATLQASLQSRLDSLGEARNLAQIGAVIGREFSYAILAAIANSEEAGLQAALAQLVQSELVFQRGHPPEATYSFKHALVQDAAYASLLLETRRGLHGRIARYIEEETPDLAENQPELLAQHYQQAREYAISVDYRLAAARRAAERSATDEAIRHLERGLKLSEQLHDGADKVNRQLDLFAYLSASYTARYAYASNQTRQIVERAFGLIGKGGSLEREFTAIYSISLLNGNLGKLDKTREGAVALRQRAEQIGDPELQCIAWRLDGFPRFFLGQIEDALSPLRKGFACYDPQKNIRIAAPNMDTILVLAV